MPMPPKLTPPPSSQLGVEIPFNNPHALSVSLPTWSDNVGWASGDEKIVNAMSTGYPRFFIHRKIQKLGELCMQRIGVVDRLTLLFSTARTAGECISYLKSFTQESEHTSLQTYTVYLPLPSCRRISFGRHHLEVHLVTYPLELHRLAKSFWTHTGMGISSRYAEVCLSVFPKQGIDLNACLCGGLNIDSDPNMQATTLVLRHRIATLCVYGKLPHPGSPCVNGVDSGPPISQTDVFLFPTGMSAIWHAHQLAVKLHPGAKSVCFGFPYTDTVKILEKWGPGCIFYGDHPDANLAAFEQALTSLGSCSTAPPVSALFCECPSNPLLQTPNLPRLRQLADKYGFLIIIDDTIGNFVNVNTIQYVDIVATSLSKLFSGNADVMGGSLVLNPQSTLYEDMKSALNATYVNDNFLPDIVRMEINSRDFESRVRVINSNTQAVCRYLRSRSTSFAAQSGSRSKPSTLVIKEVLYPEWVTRANFDLVRRPGRDDNFGPLFTLTFESSAASEAFYNALQCAKGPSLGTNFTLSCPYTILAHYRELEWAVGYGIDEHIVRVSVGMEDLSLLMKWFERAVGAAESTAKVQSDVEMDSV